MTNGDIRFPPLGPMFGHNMNTGHSFDAGDPQQTHRVIVDLGPQLESSSRIDALGPPPVDPDSIVSGEKIINVSFYPPLRDQEKAGPVSADKLAATMGVGGLAINWTSAPSPGYGTPDTEVAQVYLKQGWSGELLQLFFGAVEQNMKSPKR